MPQNKMLPSRLVRLLAALREGEYNAKELAAMSGLAYLTVLAYLRALHEAKLIHVARYAKDALGRESLAIYKLLAIDVADAPAPARIPRTEQQRLYRERRRKRARVAPIVQATDEQLGQARAIAAHAEPPQEAMDEITSVIVSHMNRRRSVAST